MFHFGPDFTCVVNPFGCAWSWLEGLPFLYVLLAGVVIGMILGAVLGKVGVAAVLTLGAAFLIWRKVESRNQNSGFDPDYETGENELSGNSGELPRKKPKTLLDLLRG